MNGDRSKHPRSGMEEDCSEGLRSTEQKQQNHELGDWRRGKIKCPVGERGATVSTNWSGQVQPEMKCP